MKRLARLFALKIEKLGVSERGIQSRRDQVCGEGTYGKHHGVPFIGKVGGKGFGKAVLQPVVKVGDHISLELEIQPANAVPVDPWLEGGVVIV